MRIVESSQEMVRVCRQAAHPLGLVPTMGALHQGHLELVRRARGENDTVAVSIFVNPAQFGAGEDLSKYPRDLDRDLDLLRREKTDLVFLPGTEDVYPPGFGTWVDVDSLAGKLEGAHRPGHFRGVATVVTKLFNLARPERAYFGQKDGQQALVVRRMVRDLAMGLDVVIVPTVREPDGLALSSRNVYLTPEQRRAAPVIYRAIRHAEESWRSGAHDADLLRQQVRRELESEPLIESIDYVSLADGESLEELDTARAGAMVSVAVRLGQVRLIDNLILD